MKLKLSEIIVPCKVQSQFVALTVNFMCQLGLAIVYRYLLKHYSRCFCRVAFWMGLTHKSVVYK